MSELDKEIESLESTLARLKELKARQVEVVKKWEPAGGRWYINSDGGIINMGTTPHTRLFGLERPTYEQAERAYDEMRRFNRLLALRDELCGDFHIDWKNGKRNYYIYFAHSDDLWFISADTSCQNVMPYFSTQELAQRACDMLNSGEVEL